MTVSFRPLVTALTVLMLFSPLPLLAQSDEDEQDQTGGDPTGQGPSADPSSGPGTDTATPGRPKAKPIVTVPVTTPVTVATTNKTVIASLNAAAEYCSLGTYAVDCLSERLGVLANDLKGQAEFNEVREILTTTSKKLNRVARRNRSRTQPSAEFITQGDKPEKTTRRLIPVAESKIETAVSEAIEVIEEAQTLLLRSAANSGSRSVQFQRIASAIGSNKVLLRSL